MAESVHVSHCFDGSFGRRSRGIQRLASVASAAFLAAALVCSQGAVARAQAPDDAGASGVSSGTVSVGELPREAVNTLGLVAEGGPYPFEKDGIVFGNYEQQLPKHRRGYYHEYTVPTPRAHNRGARRIVCGGPLRCTDNCYYTDDHYASFKRIVE
ncbi:ribonuclease [Paraburkholderia sp. A1RO-5]|uniref:ribonuclease n=1 Tax=unclassified Paraburkholderia TaxID=2615204 RepID=UPI003BA2DD20